MPHSDFATSSGFPNLSTSYSFRHIPSLFQLDRTRGVRALQRLLLSGCRLHQSPSTDPASSYEVAYPIERLPSGTDRFPFEKRRANPVSARGCEIDGQIPTSSFEVVCPSWLFHCLGACPSCEEWLPALFAFRGLSCPKVRSAVRWYEQCT